MFGVWWASLVSEWKTSRGKAIRFQFAHTSRTLFNQGPQTHHSYIDLILCIYCYAQCDIFEVYIHHGMSKFSKLRDMLATP